MNEHRMEMEREVGTAEGWIVFCSCGWQSPVAPVEYRMRAVGDWRDHRDVIESQRIDTETNRQAIVAYVLRERAKGTWPTAVGATPVIYPDFHDDVFPDDSMAQTLHRLMRSAPVRMLCARMGREGVLTFSSHGYLGVGEKAPF